MCDEPFWQNVPADQLPWPWHLHRCALQARFEAGRRSYPDVPGHHEAAIAEVFDRLGPDDFARCPYHQPDWPRIATIAAQIGDKDTWKRLADSNALDPTLDETERHWLATIFTQPITCRLGTIDGLNNGQHRSCALRAANVPAIPVKASPADPSSPIPSNRPRDVIEHFWHHYFHQVLRRRRIPALLARPLARACIRWPRLRRLLIPRRETGW